MQSWFEDACPLVWFKSDKGLVWRHKAQINPRLKHSLVILYRIRGRNYAQVSLIVSAQAN
jgi:hypothetical protein